MTKQKPRRTQGADREGRVGEPCLWCGSAFPHASIDCTYRPSCADRVDSYVNQLRTELARAKRRKKLPDPVIRGLQVLRALAQPKPSKDVKAAIEGIDELLGHHYLAIEERLLTHINTDLEHKARHAELHRALDELAADWMRHTGRRMSSATVLELLEWSHTQTINPTEIE